MIGRIHAMCRLTLCVALVLELVLLVAAVTLCMVRLGLTRTATVLALLDGTTFGIDVMQFSIWVASLAHGTKGRIWSTPSVGAAYHCGCSRSHDGP